MSDSNQIFKTGNEKEQFVKLHTDPFKKDCFESAYFWISKSWNNGALQYSANVKFKNGNTSGEQKFIATNFTDLVLQVEAFIKSLEQ